MDEGLTGTLVLSLELVFKSKMRKVTKKEIIRKVVLFLSSFWVVVRGDI